MQGIGRILVVLGLVLAAIGAVFWLFGHRLGWLGRLPGDIRIGDSVYIPLATSLLLSIVLTLVLNIVLRLLGR